MKNRTIIICTLLILVVQICLPLVNADDEFGYNNPELPIVPVPEVTTITFQNNTGSVNSSDYWDNMDIPNATQMEDSDAELNIKESWLTTFGNNLWCALTGCTMSGDLNMDSNEIHNLAGLNLTQDINLIDKNWLVPAPVLNNHTVNKKYVDDATASTAFDFFFNNESSDISGSFNMTESDLERPESSLDSASLGAGTFGVFNFTTLVGQPEFNALRQGIYDVHVHLSKAGTKPVTITPKLYNVSSDGSVSNLLITFESAIITTVGLPYELHGVLTEPIMLNDNDRLTLALEATVGATGSNVVVTIELEGTTDSHLTVETSTNAFEKIFIRRDGTNTLTGNWDVGDFNISGINWLKAEYGNFTNVCIGNDCINSWSSVNQSAAGGIWTNVSGTAFYNDNVNTSGNLTVYGNGLFFGQVNKTKLYHNGNVRIGGHFDSGGYWGTSCYETDLTGIGGDSSIWCIDNGGDNLRFYDPNTSDVSMRANRTGWQIGDGAHPKDLVVSRNSIFGGNVSVGERVGIGTASPDTILHVYENSAGTGANTGIRIEQDGDGDAPLTYRITGVVNWVAGVDNTDNAYKIAESIELDTATRLTIEAGGDVGIGTASPVSILSILGTSQTGTDGLFIGRSALNGFGYYNDQIGSVESMHFAYTSDGWSSSSILMTISELGSIGIGTTTPEATSELDVDRAAGTSKVRIAATDGLNDSWINFEVNNDEWSLGYDQTDDTFRLTHGDTLASTAAIIVDNTEEVGIGVLPTQKLDVNGRIRMRTWTADGDVPAYRDALTDSIAIQTSDIRLKKDIDTLDNSLEIIKQIGTYMYHALDDDSSSPKRLGLMAQDLLPIFPELTYNFTQEGSSETFYGVYYDKIPVLLLKGIQEQQTQIESLDSEVNTLQDENELMKQSLCNLGEIIWCP